jgi:protease II
MTQRWVPLMKRGWAVAIGFFRGGGDHTPEWEDAGRVHGREKTLEDAEAVVWATRRAAGISAKKTVLYGRSAGGLWVGGLTAKYPNGELAGSVYMEVPYLDALRTTTNRSLPLTDIETDEFGLPEARLSDMASMLRWSPMELMPEGGIPGVFQIVRTGLNDSEVYAYESAKWIVRSKSHQAHLVINGDQGHFVSGDLGREQQAQDLAVILARSL